MKGMHAILQAHCSICIGQFKVNDYLAMRVVEIGANMVTGNPAGVMIEYLHKSCMKEGK